MSWIKSKVYAALIILILLTWVSMVIGWAFSYKYIIGLYHSGTTADASAGGRVIDDLRGVCIQCGAIRFYWVHRFYEDPDRLLPTQISKPSLSGTVNLVPRPLHLSRYGTYRYFEDPNAQVRLNFAGFFYELWIDDSPLSVPVRGEEQMKRIMFGLEKSLTLASHDERRCIVVPFWFLFLSLSVPLFFFLRRFRRRRRRVALGLCVECGYDLRATPERCSECGALPVERASSSRRSVFLSTR